MSASHPAIHLTDHSSTFACEDDSQLIAALRAGNERAFITVISRYHDTMVRLAMIYVQDKSVAEEVVQETWLAVLKGLDHFEQRSTLKTWISHILLNQAKRRG